MFLLTTDEISIMLDDVPVGDEYAVIQATAKTQLRKVLEVAKGEPIEFYVSPKVWETLCQEAGLEE